VAVSLVVEMGNSQPQGTKGSFATSTTDRKSDFEFTQYVKQSLGHLNPEESTAIEPVMWKYRVFQEEKALLRGNVPYVKLYRFNPQHLYPKFNAYSDNGQRSLKL
jgi:hypothetical protein